MVMRVSSVSVTTYSPMKRGLKDIGQVLPRYFRFRYNLFPDEKGTESSQMNPIQQSCQSLQPIPR